MQQSPRRGLPSRICRFWTRVLLRLVQFCASLVAFIALRTACRSQQRLAGSSRTVAIIVSSTALNFASIVNFLVFLYALAFLIFVEWLRLCSHSVRYCEHGIDVAALVLMTVASFVLLFSDIVLNCRWTYRGWLHCGHLYLAVITSFISALAFLGILLLDGCTKGKGAGGNDAHQRRNVENGGPYTSQGSPQGNTGQDQSRGGPPVVEAQPAR